MLMAYKYVLLYLAFPFFSPLGPHGQGGSLVAGVDRWVVAQLGWSGGAEAILREWTGQEIGWEGRS